MTSFPASLEGKVESVVWRSFPDAEVGWDRAPPVCHSIIEMETDRLFDCVNWKENVISQPNLPNLNNLDYPVRKVCYALVTGTRDVWNEDAHNVDRFLTVRWAIRGMNYDGIYIGESDTNIINGMEIPALAVAEVLGPRDSSHPPDPYVEAFFIPTSSGWGMRYVPESFDEYGFCCACETRNACARVGKFNVWRMAQMYVDLLEEDNLDNKQKRFICYKMYTWYTYGYLGLRNRLQINTCIEKEIKQRFPNLDEEEYVGFSEAQDV